MKPLIKKAVTGLAVAGAALGTEAAVNHYLSVRGGTLETVLPGRQKNYDWRLGRVWYSVAGEGPPVLLVHGIGAGASSFEWRRTVADLSKSFEVYAIDLLGFGQSARPAMTHYGRYYVQLIDDFIRYVIGREVSVIASSHSAAYAIRLSYTRPERIRSLVVICPVGLHPTSMDSPALQRAGRLLATPLLGESAYYALTSRANIARTLREDLYFDAGLVNDPLIDQYYSSAHQPGGRYTTAAFLQGDLDLGIRQEFTALKQPVLIVWGAESCYTPLSQARAYQEANPGAILHIFQASRQLPHDEKPDDFLRLIHSWLKPQTADQILRVLQ